MSFSTNFHKVSYECIDCKEDIPNFEIRYKGDVECPNCGGEVYLQAIVSQNRRAFVRKYVKDLRKNDLFYFSSVDESYLVAGLRKLNKNKISVALMGFGSVTLEEDDWVNCTIGTW